MLFVDNQKSKIMKRKLNFKKETIAKLELKGDVIGGYTGYKSCKLCFFTEQDGCVSKYLKCPSDKCLSDNCYNSDMPTICWRC